MTDEEPQIITKELTENENHEPTPETSRNPEISQDTPTQNSPKTPENNPEIDAQKKQEKQLTQEVKSTIYAQTQTLTTQTHTDIKKTIYETQRLQLNTIASFVSLPLSFL